MCPLAGCFGGDGDPDVPDGENLDEARECANGKKDAAEFAEDPFAQASIVQMANSVSASELSIFIDVDAAANLVAARKKDGKFDTVAQVGCVKGIGAAFLAELNDLSLGECGLGDAAPADKKASPRACAQWAMVCGNEPFDKDADDQRDCESPAPEGRFTREVAEPDKFAMLPVEITFADGRYSAEFSDGRSEEGRAQQADKKISGGGLMSFMELRADHDMFEKFGFFVMHLEDDGERLRLDPIIGPVGRDIKAPTYQRDDDAAP